MIPALYQNAENHVFHTMLMHMSMSLFGSGELAIRLPVLIAACAVLPASFFVLASVYQRSTALWSTAFMAVSSAITLYAGNSRGYMIQLLLTFMLVGCIQLLKKREHSFAWFMWVVGSALSFWTVPTTFFIYVGLWLWLAVERYQNQMSLTPLWKNSVYVGLLILVLYSPALIVLSAGSVNVMLPQTQGVGAAFSFIKPLTMEWGAKNVWVLMLIQAFAVLGLIKSTVEKKWLAPLLVLSYVLTTLFFFVPYSRPFMVFCPFFYALMVEGIQWFARLDTRAVTALCSLLFTWMSFEEVVQRRSFYRRQDAFQLAPHISNDLKVHLKPGDKVVAECVKGHTLCYYLKRQGLDVRLNDNAANRVDLCTFEMKGTSKAPRLWVVRHRKDKDGLGKGQTVLTYGDVTVDVVKGKLPTRERER
jgi:hypothetical protein